MHRYISAAIVIITSLATFTARAQTVELEDMQGQKYQKNFPVEDKGYVSYNIPLPEGEWVLVRGNTYTTSGTSAKMKEVFLASIEKNNLNAFVYVRAKADGTQTRWLDEPCKGEDFLYKNDYGMKLWDQRCLTIRQSTFLQNSDNKVQQIAREFLKKQDAKFETSAIGIRFMTYTRQGKYLYIDMAVFPSSYGLASPIAESPVTSPWHLSNYQADPQKVRFIKDLAEWAEKYTAVVYKSFEQDKRQNAEIPAFSWKQ